MKNGDLEWARDWAGLSQAKAAELMGVSKKTWGRWESGSHPTAAGTLKRFKDLTAMPTEIEQSRLRYDREGYPQGYSLKRFRDDAEAAAEASGDDADYDRALDAMEATLEAAEGGEYEGRARERYRLLMVELGQSDADITTALAEHDAEAERWNKQKATNAAAGDSRPRTPAANCSSSGRANTRRACPRSAGR